MMSTLTALRGVTVVPLLVILLVKNATFFTVVKAESDSALKTNFHNLSGFVPKSQRTHQHDLEILHVKRRAVERATSSLLNELQNDSVTQHAGVLRQNVLSFADKKGNKRVGSETRHNHSKITEFT
ncbi:uncharacterized protein LOC143228500 [Tachypleus tridentatus]|uniref:uncharacterized protein LOC143228500 n=1 Tax=Tachypleus tridentatus TaxID=6853 RepID=UPI003FD09843